MAEIGEEGVLAPAFGFADFRAPDLAAHYWAVAGSPDGHHREDIRDTVSHVFSSAAAAYVPVTDPAYVAWCAAGNAATAIDTEANLDAVLMPLGVGTSGRFRLATGRALIAALTDDQANALSATKVKDRLILTARGDDLVPETNPKVARIADKVGLKPAAWFDAALGAGAT